MTKVIDTLSIIDRTEIQAIAKDINDEFSMANEHASKAIGHYLQVGKLLADARGILKGDKEYGIWRKENTTLSQSWALKLSRVWDTYGDKPPREIPISTLAELTTLPPAKRKELEADAADPEKKTPSVRDVKKVKKETKPLVGNERIEEQLKKKEPALPTLSPEEQAQIQIDMPIHERIAYWNMGEKSALEAFILLGLPPFFDGSPNIDTIILLVGAFRTEYQMQEFDEAYGAIKEEMK